MIPKIDKTENLGLNQWKHDDPVRVEDFNEDNAKIDAAVSEVKATAEAAYREVKLFDVTTEVLATTVELNLSDIDITEYTSLTLYQLTPATSSINLRLNKLTEGYVIYQLSAWSSTSSNRVYAEGNTVSIDLCSRITYIQGVAAKFKQPDIQPMNLATIDLMGNAAGTGNFPVGTRFVLWGVKK